MVAAPLWRRPGTAGGNMACRKSLMPKTVCTLPLTPIGFGFGPQSQQFWECFILFQHGSIIFAEACYRLKKNKLIAPFGIWQACTEPWSEPYPTLLGWVWTAPAAATKIWCWCLKIDAWQKVESFRCFPPSRSLNQPLPPTTGTQGSSVIPSSQIRYQDIHWYLVLSRAVASG